MASSPILTVLQHSRVAPPPATVADVSLPLSFFDIFYLLRFPIHFLFFYELPLTSTQFIETIVPNLKHSLSTTLQHFFPYAANLIVFPTRTRKPEIRYVEGDSVNVTFAESNLDFNDLTGFQPRNCDKFYHLIPPLGDCDNTTSDDYAKIPVFSLQVTLFPNNGISIGMNIHHSLVDATTQFNFLKAWSSSARCGKDDQLFNGTLPIYQRVVNPKLDEVFLNRTKVETFFNKDYQIPHLSGTSDRLRATFVLRRTLIDELKKWVLTQLPTSPYVSSFTVVCAYTWCCIAKSRDVDEREAFLIPLDCRKRMDPPIPEGYFGNCIWGSVAIADSPVLMGKQGFITAAKLIGESLHKTLTDKDGIVNDKDLIGDMFSGEKPVTMISIAGTPKIKLYDVDFGWGRPKKLERISLDYGNSISIDAGKESDQDMEIGVCLTAIQMQVFMRMFNLGLEPYI